MRGARLIITTTDPITGEHPESLKFKPNVIVGAGRLAVKIYFESEEIRRANLQRNRDVDKPSPDDGLPA